MFKGKMKLLLHTCCAPCSVYCIDSLRAEGIEPTVYWFNPNIHPYMEYKARRDTLKEYDVVMYVSEYERLKEVVRNLSEKVVIAQNDYDESQKSLEKARQDHETIEKEIDDKVYSLRKPIFLNKAVHIPVSSLPMPVVYYLENRGGNMTDISFKFNEYGFHFSWTEDGDEKNTIPVGMNGTALNGEIHLSGLTYKVISDAHWEDEKTLTITIRALSAVAKRILTFKFDGDKIAMYPDIYPGLEKKARLMGDTLKNVLKGAYFHAWIDFLVPRIKKILFPKHSGKVKK